MPVFEIVGVTVSAVAVLGAFGYFTPFLSRLCALQTGVMGEGKTREGWDD